MTSPLNSFEAFRSALGAMPEETVIDNFKIALLSLKEFLPELAERLKDYATVSLPERRILQKVQIQVQSLINLFKRDDDPAEGIWMPSITTAGSNAQSTSPELPPSLAEKAIGDALEILQDKKEMQFIQSSELKSDIDSLITLLGMVGTANRELIQRRVGSSFEQFADEIAARREEPSFIPRLAKRTAPHKRSARPSKRQDPDDDDKGPSTVPFRRG